MLEDEFGDVIAKARGGLGLRIEDVAARTGIPARQLTRFEGYKADPTDEQVAALAGVLALREGPLRDLARKAWEPAGPSLAWDGWEALTLTLRHITGFSSNTHLLWRVPGGEALLVDPGFEPRTIKRRVADLGLAVRHVAVTHGHSDHVGAARELAEHYGVTALIGAEDLALVPGGDRRALTAVADGERFAVGSAEFRAIAAPGHTAGGRCYVVDGACCVGDTLFAGSIGRTFGGPKDYPVHLATVRARILALPPDTRLLPGHGPGTTVAEERDHNPFA
ncbi:MAG: MBL fold metallo-hydrolase [Candidatus Sericytochromatia bacterium]|nr:MBL fold metallo-hydrolase [Candidatus Tanganyikabacteria bacterium]